ncbi:MAG: GmrSD restriction endonuclease domain-containing protein [Candidatus Nanopelagicales bacterium]
MAKVDYKVYQLVDMVTSGNLQLPEMQRQYVWTSTKVRDLLDSLYRGYPSGVILTWQPPGEVETREFAVETAAQPIGSPLLLLDGQQRLTSLSAVLRGKPVRVKWRKTPVEILFNLDHPDELTFITEVIEDADGDGQPDDIDGTDETDEDPFARINRRAFLVSSNAVLALPNWIKVTDVFKKTDAEILKSAGVTGFDDPNYDKYTARLKALRGIADYEYRVDILEPTKSYEEVTEIFVRVNSLGAKLRGSDLALAQITAKWNGSLALFNDYQAGVRSNGFDLDLGVFLRTLIAVTTGQARFLTVGSLSRATLEAGWKRTVTAFDFAVNFTKSNVHIDSATLFSSPFLLLTTAFWAHTRDFKIDDAEMALFKKWFLLANAKGHFSRGSSETILSQDLEALRGGGGAEQLLERLTLQVGRLDFSAAELAGRSARSGAFKTIFLAFRARGASDWSSHLVISPKHKGAADAIEFHHVFPKAHMKRERPDVESRAVDDIGNLAFIGAKTNKEISDQAPRDYSPRFDPADLALQLIYFMPDNDIAEHFEVFVSKRREAMAAELNSFLGVVEI